MLLSTKCFVFNKSYADFTEMADLCNDIDIMINNQVIYSVLLLERLVHRPYDDDVLFSAVHLRPRWSGEETERGRGGEEDDAAGSNSTHDSLCYIYFICGSQMDGGHTYGRISESIYLAQAEGAER